VLSHSAIPQFTEFKESLVRWFFVGFFFNQITVTDGNQFTESLIFQGAEGGSSHLGNKTWGTQATSLVYTVVLFWGHTVWKRPGATHRLQQSSGRALKLAEPLHIHFENGGNHAK